MVTVVSCKEVDQHFEVVLDGNYIRPAEGGQAGDRASLRSDDTEAIVSDTILKNEKTTLIVDTEFADGSKATLTIDMQWRRSLMRTHTAEHILAANLLTNVQGLELGYVWLEDDHGTVRFSGPSISLDEAFSAERRVQEAISSNLKVTTDLVRSEEAQTDVRARDGVTAKHKTVRVVKVGDLDASACSGLHVEQSGSIIFFKVTDVRHSEDETTIDFSTGDRAAAAASAVYNEALIRKSDFPFEMEQLGNVLDKGRRALDDYELLTSTMIDLLTEDEAIESDSEISFRSYYLSGMDSGSIRKVVKQLKSDRPKARLYFVPGLKSNIVFWTNNLSLNAEDYIGEIVAKLGGRGGGSRQVFTGGFSEVDAPEELYKKLVSSVGEALSNA
jgi:alanyl-tRNA synthetase